jgi:hypothetical protein
LAALESPITYTNKVSPAIPVTVVNGKTGKQTTNKVTALGFNPALTTPTAVLAIVSARIPNFDPSLVSNAVAATLLYTTNANGVVFPVWGPQPAAASVSKATNSQNLLNLNTKTANAQIKNATSVATAALTAAVKAYAAGTKQWAAVPKGGPSNSVVYLPNFGKTPLGPTINPQTPDLKGLSDTFAAVSASAINALGAPNTNAASNTAGLYGQTAANVAALTKALTAVAIKSQVLSASTVDNVSGYPSGALGAEGLGLITQVAGANNSNWANSSVNFLLQAVVSGATAAVGKTSNLVAVATGVAQGFYADYLETTTDNPKLSPTAFATLNGNASAIVTAFKNALGGSAAAATTLTNLGITGGATGSVEGYFANIANAIANGTNGVWANSISGAKGINLGVGTNTTALLNGVGTPVTDTTGL